MSKLGKKKIHQLLLESIFDPKKPGPMKIIVETNNITYLLLRSKELISEALIGPHLQEKLKQAISLLALVRAHHALETEENKI